MKRLMLIGLLSCSVVGSVSSNPLSPMDVMKGVVGGAGLGAAVVAVPSYFGAKVGGVFGYSKVGYVAAGALAALMGCKFFKIAYDTALVEKNTADGLLQGWINNKNEAEQTFRNATPARQNLYNTNRPHYNTLFNATYTRHNELRDAWGNFNAAKLSSVAFGSAVFGSAATFLSLATYALNGKNS